MGSCCGAYLDMEGKSYVIGGNMAQFENINKLIEGDAFIDSMKIEGAVSKNKFLLKVFTAFCTSSV